MSQEKKHGRGGARLEHGTPPAKKRGGGGRTALLIVGLVLVIVLLIVAAVKSALFVKPDLPKDDQTVTNNDQQATQQPLDYEDGIRPKSDGERKSEDYYTILILGRDTGGGGNTDTMLLASYDVTNQKATVMSIPRDTMVNVDWDVKKINSVYNWYGGGEKGIQRLYQEISQLVGFQPDFQVVVEWDAVGEIVDAIGGVWFDVPYEMDYTDPLQDLRIRQEKGYRLLTGEDAMQVIRWRQNNANSPYGNAGGVGDAGRMEIQQGFLKAMLKQLLQIKNVGNIDKLAKVFEENVTTDLSLQNILWFGQQAVFGGLKVEDVKFLTMPFKTANAWSRSYDQELSYVVPKSAELLELVNGSLSPFAETFALSDLDIMSVNSDGSVSSSTGNVEDKEATHPKSYWLELLEQEKAEKDAQDAPAEQTPEENVGHAPAAPEQPQPPAVEPQPEVTQPVDEPSQQSEAPGVVPQEEAVQPSADPEPIPEEIEPSVEPLPPVDVTIPSEEEAQIGVVPIS